MAMLQQQRLPSSAEAPVSPARVPPLVAQGGIGITCRDLTWLMHRQGWVITPTILVDKPSCVIWECRRRRRTLSQETVVAQDMLMRFSEWQGREPEWVAPSAA